MQIALIREKALMRRRIFDSEGHACFITFSCFRRWRLLDDKQAKGIVIHFGPVKEPGAQLPWLCDNARACSRTPLLQRARTTQHLYEPVKPPFVNGTEKIVPGSIECLWGQGGPERAPCGSQSTMFLMCFPTLKPGKSSITCITTR